MNAWLGPLRKLLLILIAFASCVAMPARAAVEVAFYSRELGANNFPHAFVTIKGQLDADGSVVDHSFGFTAKTVSPAILMGSVGGKVIAEHPHYVAKSDRQFAVTLSDEGYGEVMATIEKWRARKQPSYNLNRANCVHFVGEVAQAAGMRVEFRPELMKKPRSFLLAVREANRGMLDEPGPSSVAGTQQ